MRIYELPKLWFLISVAASASPLFGGCAATIVAEDITPEHVERGIGALYWLDEVTVQIANPEWTQVISSETYRDAIESTMAASRLQATTHDAALATICIDHYDREVMFPDGMFTSSWNTQHRLRVYDSSGSQVAELLFTGNSYVGFSFSRPAPKALAFGYAESVKDGLTKVMDSLASADLVAHLKSMEDLEQYLQEGLLLAELERMIDLPKKKELRLAGNEFGAVLRYLKVPSYELDQEFVRSEDGDDFDEVYTLTLCQDDSRENCTRYNIDDTLTFVNGFTRVLEKYNQLNRTNDFIRLKFDLHNKFIGWDTNLDSSGMSGEVIDEEAQIPEKDLERISKCVIERGPVLNCADVHS